jgi:hypothetical protein
MGLRPTQGNEKALVSSNRSPWKLSRPLCHPDRSEAKRRDLQFRGPFVEMFFDRAQLCGMRELSPESPL